MSESDTDEKRQAEFDETCEESVSTELYAENLEKQPDSLCNCTHVPVTP